MDSEELLERVRALRAGGRSPKEIARALGVPPATIAPLVRAIAQADQAGAAQRQLVIRYWSRNYNWIGEKSSMPRAKDTLPFPQHS